MKKTILLSSLLSTGFLQPAGAQEFRVHRVSIDIADVKLPSKIRTIEYLKKSKVLRPHGTIWVVDQQTLKDIKTNGISKDAQELKDILGPDILLEEVDAVDIVLASQDLAF